MPNEKNNDPQTLAGRVALVTGASRGIGSAVALALAQSGCAVAINYLKSKEKADAVARQIEATGGRAFVAQADVAIAQDVARLVTTVRSTLGPIDVLVNNAGINPSYPLESVGEEEWNKVLAVNLTSAFLVSQAVLPEMRKRKWGRIIMLSSVAAQTGGVIGPHYAASKAGMLGLMHSYANLLAKEGITANAVAPALIDTDMLSGNDKINPTLLPVQRFGSAEEVAQVVVLLATNGFITGQTINVNGGWYPS
ncbi:MAG: 3-oxoacyl-ACP reductase FabG [Candidatus Acidiferrum sp.]